MAVATDEESDDELEADIQRLIAQRRARQAAFTKPAPEEPHVAQK